MLAINSQRIPSASVFDSVLLRLVMLFVGIFLFTLASFLAYSTFVTSIESYSLESNIPPANVVDDIDPKIASELSKVMEVEDVALDFNAKDPFLDRLGIGKSIGANSNNYVAQTLASAIAGAPAAPNRTVGESGSSGGSTSGSRRIDGRLSENGSFATAPVMNTKDRYGIWADRARFGTLGEPSASIFSIEDLVPVGVVGGGTSQREIMFFSQAADRILSFPVGTKFFDGWIIEVITEGVIFGTGDKVYTRRLKSWGRSIQTKGAASYSMNYLNEFPKAGISTKGGSSAAGGNN